MRSKHIQNAWFADGWSGWSLSISDSGSRFKTVDSVKNGLITGKENVVGFPTVGDSYMLMARRWSGPVTGGLSLSALVSLTSDNQYSFKAGDVITFDVGFFSTTYVSDALTFVRGYCQSVGATTISFDGQANSTGGRYVAKNGRLIVTTPPEGRKIQQLWTTRTFADDFTLKLEFRATPNADSGVFLRGPQLQCRDFALAGPYKDLENYKPQDWNELIVEVKGTTARCTCNGEVIEEEFAVPESAGPIGLEGDRGQVEYRRIRIKQ